MQPYFKRDGLKQIRVKQNRGSIRSDFELIDDESGDEEMRNRKTTPGPGTYQTMTSTFNATGFVDRPNTI